MFRTQYTAHDRFLTSHGNTEKKVYSPRWLENGTLELVETGSINLYDEIQSHRDSVDINVILAKYAKTGDISILNKVTSQYLDVTGLPTSIAGFYNLLEDGHRLFDGLSVEQKAKYNNSFEQFIFTLGQHPKADPVPDPVEVITDVKE